ncbi:flagellar hook assembly protein FlgD [Sphingomonas sp. LHG3443-2]|uniref:flagellar hook assembly protein FlgD n=1 Tax=Sphingomonas sp. LHG3443-2 TaxID=2804639 RepID=UPI003CF81DB7
MTAISKPTEASTAATPPTGLFGKAGGDFDLFLKLLTTQMQNQDPLDPMDTAQYTQQLVQYSQVEQSIQQTGVLRNMLDKMSGDDLTSAGQLIGKTAEFDSSIAGLSATTPAEWRWTFAGKPSTVEAEILDSSGKVVATPKVPVDGSGTLQWDGLLASGVRAPEGAYSLKLIAKTTDGSELASTLTSIGKVQEVVSRGGELWAGLGGAALPLVKLTRIAA